MYNITFGKSRLVAHNTDGKDYLFLNYSDMKSADKVEGAHDHRIIFKDNTTLQLREVDFDTLLSHLLKENIDSIIS